ncbi:MAG: sulfite exporter TauE/SafE family protein [Microgenomates group bacterium]
MLSKAKSRNGGIIKSITYAVSGTHCHACEILIEKEIRDMHGIKSVEASTADSTVKISGTHIPEISLLNNIFKDSGYIFSKNPVSSFQLPVTSNSPDIFTSLLIVSGILIIFFILNKMGLLSAFTVNSSSYYPAFFMFGLIAGLSTCAALIGGIVVAISQRGFSSVLSFLTGRVILFGVFGAILGYFGSFFRLSLTAGAIVSAIVSLVMFIVGMQMLNIAWFKRFSFALPKNITGPLADDSTFIGRYLPFIFGGLTFFLPCGFTLTAQTLALASGDIISGGLIMLSFALGSFIPLLLIGYGSSSSQKNPRTAAYFSQVAGILVVLFAMYNLYSQSIVLGINPVFKSSEIRDLTSDIQIINGTQILKMTASASGYTPNSFTIKAGQKTRWEITDKGTSGCTNAVISKGLLGNDIINLVAGTTSVKEFTAPTAAGTYRFSCWMGMISGTIEVVQ